MVGRVVREGRSDVMCEGRKQRLKGLAVGLSVCPSVCPSVAYGVEKYLRAGKGKWKSEK